MKAQDITGIEIYVIRWALIKFAAASEKKVALQAMKIYDKLGEAKSAKLKTR